MLIRKKTEERKQKDNWFLRQSKKRRIAICSGGVVLCIVLIGVIYLSAKLGKINTDDLSGENLEINEGAIVEEGYTNVALFGIDSRNGEMEKGTRTDCLIIASLNNKTKEIRMVSVYRDTVLDIEEDYLQKCNAAYAFGGPAQAINMLNKNLDLDIQEYATVDFAAIANVIDLLGGLEIDVKEEEVKPLNKYVKETARVAGKKAHTIDGPGIQLLDGVQATTYARIRSTAGGDFTRTERQRLVIEKIVEKAQKSDLVTINKIIDELFPTIKTSFSIGEILSYAKDFMKYNIADSSGFPFEKTTDTISGLGSIVIPVTLSENVSKLHEFLYDKENYVPSTTVEVINSAIIARVGEREATDYKTLTRKTYEDTEEDKAQEHNEYVPRPDTTIQNSEKDVESEVTDNETINNINSNEDNVNVPDKKPTSSEQKPNQNTDKNDSSNNVEDSNNDNSSGEVGENTGENTGGNVNNSTDEGNTSEDTEGSTGEDVGADKGDEGVGEVSGGDESSDGDMNEDKRVEGNIVNE